MTISTVPSSIHVEVTSSCNERCSHCYNPWRFDSEKRPAVMQMTAETAARLSMQFGEAKIRELTLSGGEPLLNWPAVAEFVRWAGPAGVHCTLNTNLVLLTEEHADFLQEHKLASVLTSLLGPNAQVHDARSGVPGSFDKTIRATEMLAKRRICVTANMVVSRPTLPMLRDTARTAANAGVGTFAAGPAIDTGCSSPLTDIPLSHAELMRIFEDLTAVADELKIFVESLFPFPFCGLVDLKDPERFMHRRCGAGFTVCTIGSDGEARPCPQHVEAYGKPEIEGLEAVWSRMGRWRSTGILSKECLDCPALRHCGGGCHQSAWASSGSFAGPLPGMRPENKGRVKELLVKLGVMS